MKDKAKQLEYMRTWRSEHQEKCDFYNTRRYERNRERIIEQNGKWQKAHPSARKARNQLFVAIRNGDVEKPRDCSSCGRIGDIQGHHEDYSLPFDVIWFCRSCHKRFHTNKLVGIS